LKIFDELRFLSIQRI